ncbi:MAG: Gfo/Idh/MocA family oxidoreductase [Sediminicola sp.]
MKSNRKNFNRREFLKSSALAGTFLGLAPTGLTAHDKMELKGILENKLVRPTTPGKTVRGLKVAPMETVRVAFIGLGNRGVRHVRTLQQLAPKAQIMAICDIRENKAKESAALLKGKNKKAEVYFGGEDDWKKMAQRDDLDLVIISTPWKSHAPMAEYCMRQGKHVAVEVPMALTLDETWKLIATAEETQRNCMMLENVCYGDEELWLLNMVKQGVLGTLTYAEAAYFHDLKENLFNDKYYEKWRIRHHVSSNANLYPTHGLGPVAQYMDIGRGDRFDHLISMSSLEASLTEYAQTVESDNEFYGKNDFAHGDISNSLIKTHSGKCILVQHDVVTPRPYSRINALAGTKGYHEGYPSKLSLAAENKGHQWLDETAYKEMRQRYDNPIWKRLNDEISKNGDHGGMDYVMMYRLIDNFNSGRPLDMDVYDGADWSVITPLSATSVQLGGVPVRFPDFTGGLWKEKSALEILKNEL